PRQRETAEEEQRAETVNQVIDVKTVTRPCLPAHARERPVEAVAKPVHRQADHDAEQKPATESRGPETAAGGGHREEREERQLIRGGPRRQSPGDPDETVPFDAREHARAGTRGFFKLR